MVPALVLTAGLATRLRPLSFVRAKAALPVAGVPLITRILRSLHAAGVSDVALNLHHLPHTLTSIVGDGSSEGLRVRYSWEVPVLGSAGGPKRAIPLLRNLEPLNPPVARGPEPTPPFLIVNGDTLTDVDLAAVVAEHARSGALVTMAVVPNHEPDKYGGVLVAADGTVTGFGRRGSREPSFHFIGVQVAEPEVFDPVPPDTPYETVNALYPSLIASRPGSIRACLTNAGFMDIGTPSDYLATSLELAAREGTNLTLHAEISETARVERSILWDDVIVEDGAMLRECIVTDGVRVPADTSWHGVTIRPASGDLAPGERRIEGLAIASL